MAKHLSTEASPEHIASALKLLAGIPDQLARSTALHETEHIQDIKRKLALSPD